MGLDIVGNQEASEILTGRLQLRLFPQAKAITILVRGACGKMPKHRAFGKNAAAQDSFQRF